MKSHYSYLGFLFLFNIALGQDTTLFKIIPDSIYQKIAVDTQSVDLLNSLSINQLIARNFELSTAYNEKALHFSKALDYDYGVAMYYYNLGRYHVNTQNFEQGINTLIKSGQLFERLYKEKNNLRARDYQFHTYSFIVGEYGRIGSDSIFYYARPIIDDSKYIISRNVFIDDLYWTYLELSIKYEVMNNLDSSDYYTNEAITYCKLYGLESSLPILYETKYRNEIARENYVEALNNVDSSYFYAKKYKNVMNLFGAHMTRASIFEDFFNYEKALEELKEAEVVSRYDREINLLAKSEILLKEMHLNPNLDYRDSIQHLYDTIFSFLVCEPMSNELADFHVQFEDYEAAYNFLDQQIRLARECDDFRTVAASLNKKVNLLLYQKQFKKAIQYYSDLYTLLNSIDDYSIINKIKLTLSRLEYYLGNYEQAEELYQNTIAYRDSVEVVKTIGLESFITQNVEQQKQIELLGKENELLKVRKEKAQIRNILLSVSALALLILTLLFFDRRRILKENQRITQELSYNLDLLVEELYEGSEVLSEDSKTIIQDQADLLKNWSKDIVDHSTNTTFIRSKLKGFQGLLEEKLAQQQAFTEQIRQIAAKKEEELLAFNYTVGHDLKLPLTNAVNSVDLLLANSQNNMNEEMLDYVQEFKSSVLYMEDMIDGINQYSKTDNLKLAKKEIDLNVMLYKIVKELNKSMSVASKAYFDIAPSLPSIYGDTLMLRQVFTNLLSNAVKFSKYQASPIVKVTAREQKDHISIWVKDNGVGIKENRLHRIFQLFHSAHSREQFEGTGVGLAIVKRIIDRHGGNIQVESEEGKGTVFKIELKRKNRSTE